MFVNNIIIQNGRVPFHWTDCQVNGSTTKTAAYFLNILAINCEMCPIDNHRCATHKQNVRFISAPVPVAAFTRSTCSKSLFYFNCCLSQLTYLLNLCSFNTNVYNT